jgi:DNA repair protein RecN (Recombination protein N)
VRLGRLEIEDFGLIARASVEFAERLTSFTGETGSGKTMLVGALAFVLGERSSPDVVRGGAARARVTLEIDADDALRERLASEGFESEPGEPAIFVREVQANGKSSGRINGRPATAAQLREAGECFVDLVGQHEQQRLLAHDYQLELLDRFAGEAASDERAALGAAYARAGTLARELAELREWVGRGLTDVEFARFALAEIDDVKLELGEDVRLRERRDFLANAERIAGALGQAHEALSGDEGLGAAAMALTGVARFGDELARLADVVTALQSDATDAAIAISRAAEATEFDASEFESVGERLDLLERLKKKYGGSLEAVLRSRAQFAAGVERYSSSDERQAAVESSLAAAQVELERHAKSLSDLRAKAARRLERAVAEELNELAMPAARFEVALERAEEIGPQGHERVEFALAPNPGEPLRPLARAASGGELSRVVLALVVVLADKRERTALVFDEIDAGVGGATARAVGQRLGALARNAQVLCVTHLAQIAAWADRHYALRKHERADATTIEVVELRDRTAVLDELARMMGGKVHAAAVEHAETLLRDARKRKAGRLSTNAMQS